MMLIHRISHWKMGRTKDIFMPFDTTFFLTLLKVESPTHDAAIHEACLYIGLINEVLSSKQLSDDADDLQYAVSPQGEVVHLITKNKKNNPVFWKISEEPVPHDYQLRFLSALSTKYTGIGRVISSIEKHASHRGLSIDPWECVL